MSASQSSPFDITERVRPAALPHEDLEITEGNVLVSGTGKTETGKLFLRIYYLLCSCYYDFLFIQEQ